jgi:hypothetical protein
MFRNVLRSSATTNAFMAGAAAALTGSAFVASQKSEIVSGCEDNTVVGLLLGISRKVNSIEAILGNVEQKPVPVKKNGIDIVLGAQWGDEGKGKLVDVLSQVGWMNIGPGQLYYFSSVPYRSAFYYLIGI